MPALNQKTSEIHALAESRSFDELCALQGRAIADLAKFKAEMFDRWAPESEKAALNAVAAVRGAEQASFVLDTLFWPVEGGRTLPNDGSLFVDRVARDLGRDAANAVKELLAENDPPIAPAILDKIAVSRNEAAFIIAASAFLGMEPGVSFSDRPFRLKIGDGPDPVASTVAQYGGFEIGLKDPAPAGKVVIDFSGDDWTRSFAFDSYDKARQSTMAIVMATQGEMIIGNARA